MYAWNWAAAERNFRRSLALDPTTPTPITGTTATSSRPWAGRTRRSREARRARELDPLSLTIIGAARPGRSTSAGRAEDAVGAASRNVVAMDTTFILTNE